MNFCEKVKFVRRKLFLSQVALAKELKVCFSTVNRWERGHAKPNFKAQAEFDKFCRENSINLKESKK